ncbi:MAG: hypothetical protein ABJA66_08075 [Actinomycetota bacterium]
MENIKNKFESHGFQAAEKFANGGRSDDSRLANGKIEKLWAQEAEIWTNTDEAKWLGWLDIVERQLAGQQKFADLQAEVGAENFSHILLLGMGGSSLCPEVLSFTFDDAEDLPVPNQKYTFGLVKAAQARGDFVDKLQKPQIR